MSELSFKILGEFPQILEINLEPEKILIANGATLLFMDEEIFLQIRDTDGADEVEEAPEENELEENEEEEALFGEEGEEENNLENEILEGLEEEPFGEDDEEEAPEEDDSKKSILDKFISVVKRKLQKSPKKEGEDATLEELLETEKIEEGSSEENEEIEEEEPPPPPILSIAHFDNQSEFVRKVAFAPITGKVLHINLAEIEGEEIYIRKESFLCARKGTIITEGIDTNLKIHRADIEDLTFSKVEGNSDIFLQAEQSFIEKKIVETEEEDDAAIRVNLGSLLAFETSLRLDLESIKTIKYLYSEEETQTILLKGTGTFWLQSSHLQQTFHRLLPYFYEEKQVEVEVETATEEVPEELSDIDDLLAQDVQEEEDSPTEMEWDMKEESEEEEKNIEESEEIPEEGKEEDQEVELPSDFDPEELEKIKAMADLDDEALKKMLGND